METNKKYEIEQLFPIVDQNYLIVNLKVDSWTIIKEEKRASIVFKNEHVSFKYVGYSNVNGKVMLKLIPVTGEELKKVISLKDSTEKPYLEI
ncbi:hypothetical protein NNC19_05020 [Clostridium sp. SHJSY1]|uniref:hypothetical protein n=1 Tax=Clostridium sp. SHJSY1 TaxID=2942483 RepID=UPI002874D6FC|nr:hypothetical protein [Clostridium sp. SHJSY1]MDS0525034.1 hypothetical protein [Clostridium sp. SHJSY1]